MRLNLEIIIIKYYGRFVSTVTSTSKPGKQWFRNDLVSLEQLCRQMCQCYLFSLRIFGSLRENYHWEHISSLLEPSSFNNQHDYWCHPSTCGSFLRESFRVLPCGERFFLWLFEKTRLPLRPCFGGFPVKLRTHIGKYIDSSFFATTIQLQYEKNLGLVCRRANISRARDDSWTAKG